MVILLSSLSCFWSTGHFWMLDFYISPMVGSWHNKCQWLEVECITIHIRDGNVVFKSEWSYLVADFQSKWWILLMCSTTAYLWEKPSSVKLHPTQSYWMEFYVLLIQKIKLAINDGIGLEICAAGIYRNSQLSLILCATRVSSRACLQLSEEKLERDYMICRKFLSVPFLQVVYLRNNSYSSLTSLQDP